MEGGRQEKNSSLEGNTGGSTSGRSVMKRNSKKLGKDEDSNLLDRVRKGKGWGVFLRRLARSDRV